MKGLVEAQIISILSYSEYVCAYVHFMQAIEEEKHMVTTDIIKIHIV